MPTRKKRVRKGAKRIRQARPKLDTFAKTTCDFRIFIQPLSSDDLGLVDYAQEAADTLQGKFPDVVFTSGRRTVAQQAGAMSANIVQNRNWIRETYVPSQERDDLQAWVNSHPAAVTKEAIATGLTGIMVNWTDDQKARFSRHFSGQAFDVQPTSGEQGDRMKAAIKALPNLRKFLDQEGGLIIWHADFEKLAI
jgi:hypothetical protein